MLIATVVGVVAFSAATDLTISPFHGTIRSIFRRFEHNDTDDPHNQQQQQQQRRRADRFLYQRMRRVRIIRWTEIFVEVSLFVLMGVVASQICVALDDDIVEGADPDVKWSWMTSFYWAIQTTTTIGYGDLTHPYGLRLFGILYLLLSTYLVGSSFGRLGSLHRELRELRRRHTWDRRPVTRRFIQELKGGYDDQGDYDDDRDDKDKVDQYEYLVASLIMLGKIDSNDLRLVMDKFRKLAGDKGFISVDTDVTEETAHDMETAEELEDDELARHEQDCE
jgi:Ion channel